MPTLLYDTESTNPHDYFKVLNKLSVFYSCRSNPEPARKQYVTASVHGRSAKSPAIEAYNGMNWVSLDIELFRD
jgi:hypothetical protein